MKKSYKKLLLFYFVLFFALILNSFVSNILSNTRMILFLMIIMIIFYFGFGFEKDRHRYIKDILLEETIFFIIFFLLYYISGMFFGFARVDNYYTIYNIVYIILPIIITILLKEFLRYQMLMKSEGNHFLFILTTLLFLFLDLSNSIYMNLNGSNYEIFLFIAITVLPTIGINIACSYIGYKTGYKPTIFFRLVIELFLYLLPFVPNPNQYIYSIVWLFVPILMCYRVYLFYQKDRDEEVLRDYHKKKIGTLILPTMITIFLVYITSGYFHYYALAIASGSMTPTICKGDVVIVEKTNQYENIEIGEIIAYKYDDIVIVHRLVEKVKDNQHYYFYTKGDANENIDEYPITEEMILGVVNLKIPYIGLPTVWLNNK